MKAKDNKKTVSSTVKVDRPHPSHALAGSLLKWMDKATHAPSIVLAQGLYLARTNEHDGLPVEHIRKQAVLDPKENQLIIKLMNDLRSPGINRQAVLSAFLRERWTRKTVFTKPAEEKKAVPLPLRTAPRKKSVQVKSKPETTVIVKRKKVEM